MVDPAPAGPARAAATSWRPVVLVVEQDDTFRGVLEMLLGELGCEVLSARGYYDALDRLEALRRLDLLLIDTRAHNGEPTGWALARVATARLASRVVYMSTGSDAEKDVHGALGPILMKPFDAEALRETVQSALRPG